MKTYLVHTIRDFKFCSGFLYQNKIFCLVSKALQIQQWTGRADRWLLWYLLQGICHIYPWAVSHCCCFKDDRHVFIQKGCLFILPRHSFFHCSVEALSKQQGGLCTLKGALPIETVYTVTSPWEGTGGCVCVS